MTNEELLLAMSDLLDVKLRAELQPLKNELHEEIRAVRDELHAEIQAVKNELHTEIQAVKNELRLEIRAAKDDLHAEIQAVRDELHAEIQAVRDELDEKIQSLDARVLQLQLNQDTVIIPTLNDIASCYTDTFKRYQAYGDKMDSVYEDVNLLNYKPKFHHVYTIPFFHIMLNFFYFTSSIYTIKSKVRQGVRGDGRGSKPLAERL